MTNVTNAGIAIQTSGIHHVSLRTTDLARARVFYIDRLGFPLLMERPGLVIFAAGSTAIALDAPGPDAAPSDAASTRERGHCSSNPERSRP